MSEKSFSCKDCNEVTNEKECAKVDYEDFCHHGYCIDCFVENCVSDEEEPEEQEECIFCGHTDVEGGNCDRCWGFYCTTCYEYDDERFVTETISPIFCTEHDACFKRRRKVLMAEPSRYRNSDDKDAIAKLEKLS